MRILYAYRGRATDTGSPTALLNLMDCASGPDRDLAFVSPTDTALSQATRSRGVAIVPRAVESLALRRPVESARRVAAWVRTLRQTRTDIVHLNELGWNFDLAVAAWVAGVPLVLHLHLAAELHPRNWHWRIARRVVLVSEEQRQTIPRFERIAHKAVVIHNPVDLERLASGRSLRLVLGIPDKTAVVGVVAQIRQGKRTDLFLDTAEWLVAHAGAGGRELVFLIIGRAGTGREDYARTISERVAASPVLAPRVKLLGSRTDIPDLLATLDVFFLPTARETLSVATVEAMAAGCPVVTTPVGGMRELFPTADHGTLVPDPSADACGEAIKRYLTRPDLAAATGRRGQASLTGRFDRATVRYQLRRLYEDCVPRGGTVA